VASRGSLIFIRALIGTNSAIILITGAIDFYSLCDWLSTYVGIHTQSENFYETRNSSLHTVTEQTTHIRLWFHLCHIFCCRKLLKMDRASLSTSQKEANRKEQLKRYASKSDVKKRVQQYDRTRWQGLKHTALTAFGTRSGKLFILTEQIMLSKKPVNRS